MSEPTLHELERELHGTELTCRGAGYDETRPGQIALALLAYSRELRAALAEHVNRCCASGCGYCEHDRRLLARYPKEPGRA